LYILELFSGVFEGLVAEFLIREAHIDAVCGCELLEIMNEAPLEGMESAEVGRLAMWRRARLRPVQLLG